MQNPDIILWIGKNGGNSNISATRNAIRVTRQTYVTFTGIESIYLYNSIGEEISASHHRQIQHYDDIAETTWRRRAIDRHGGFFITLNADDTLFSTTGKNNISLIRQVLDINTMLPIGYLMVNLSESFLADTIRDIKIKHGTSVYILD
jgi:two-component system sensor histidine kinase YesM